MNQIERLMSAGALEMSNPPKFCRDCEHFQAATGLVPDAQYAKCAASRNVNLVTGETNMRYCATERENSHLCGPEGKNWKAK